jgi:nicotinamidase-related amidase
MQALAIVDMQRWMFRFPERRAQLPTLVPALNRLAAAFATGGHPVFEVGVYHKPDRSTWSHLMVKHNYACLIEGSPDTELVQGLDLPPTRRLVRKTANSAFLRTDFEAQLRAMNVTRLFLAGAFMDGCVGLTAADAAQRGFEVCLVDDAIAHADERYRDTIMEWLAGMYELTATTTEAICGAGRAA